MHQRTTHAVTHGHSIIASDSLLYDECSTLWNTVKRRLKDWSGEFFTDPFGDLNLMILPPNADDELGPMLIVYRQHGLYMVDAFRWDEYSNVRECLTLDETAVAIESIVFSATSPRRGPSSVH